jgi:zinc/manganese transport system substrate-binding protein
MSIVLLTALSVFACEPEWAALAQELGGDKVGTFAATTALQDPHQVEARPSLIARMRNADLVVCSGAELEAGWLPLLLTQSGNDRVQRGSPGYLEASQYVLKLEVPRVVDRSMGDVHPGGNPHVHTDPRNIARIGAALSQRMAELDPPNAPAYAARSADFDKRWREAMVRWEKQAAPLKGVPVVVHHKYYSYLLNWAGMREAGSLEPRPGIPPSTAQLAELVERMKRSPAKLILYSSYNDPRAAEFLSQRTGIPKVMLPATVGGTPRAKDLFGYFDDILARLSSSP